MQLQKSIEVYLADLMQSGYTKQDIDRKAVILRRHLSYALALYHPAMLRTLLNLSEIRLYNRGAVKKDIGPQRREAAQRFVSVFRSRIVHGVSYITIAAWIHEYRLESGTADTAPCERAVEDLLRALALEIDLNTIVRNTYDHVLAYLKDYSVDRAENYSAAFFLHCRQHSWLSFEPPGRVKAPYMRTFEPDFLGTSTGLWTRRLRLYVEYLKNEKNLSDGGIDFYVRKLRVFVQWLEAQGIDKQINTPALKDFLAEREKQGAKASTRAKYVYTVRYFFDFLIYRGLQKDNPANNLSIKADPEPEGQILTELEVVRVIEYLENQIFENKDAQELKQRTIHFRALRDLNLFLLFILTGVRLSEACGMRLEDLDFTRRSVRIKAKGNRTYRKKYREILLPGALWSRLTRYLRAHRHPGPGWLWISWSGQPMTASGVNKVIAHRVQEAGVPKHISPHRLRATCASLYVRKGMDPFSLKTLLGHESITTTIDHYARLTEEELRAVWKRSNPMAGIDDE